MSTENNGGRNMKKPIGHLKLTKAGVFLVTGGGKKMIAAPIRLKAIGKRVADNTEIAEIRFVTRTVEPSV
jgi:hypothetical protein